ncbi:unnamed protein product [Bursaphelenchus okinawaensis]|uniref:Secreted protein n=1 Tax=Bursaphelenchus okinawaensis TaxID=465554 RepID=A0A811LFZ3_9BILA|nr:unnamed protein product [Bursaphelenchus okinawaensis]CAG9122218.1 unnamed protein product [Bursaphelenchus okinawaensis]
MHIIAQILVCLTFLLSCSADLEQAVRVVRFRVDYPNADLSQLNKVNNWNTILRKSVLASLKFVNKHWEVCGDSERMDKLLGNQNDCGKLQVTGEIVEDKHYRINATFIANKDPIKNTKVEATSTVYGVIQIGLRGGIFQYTNAMKLLGKPSPVLEFEDAHFCYPEYQLVNESQCRLRPENGRRRVSRNVAKRDDFKNDSLE